jgi:hypothetical protein
LYVNKGYVDIGIATGDVEATADAVRDDALAVQEVPAGLRRLDPDGHYVTLVEESR